MAKSKKKSNKMKMRGFPTHRFLRYKLEHTGGSKDNHYIDLARDLSAMNKRMYRQGRLYAVSNFTFHDNQSDLDIQVCGLRHNWPTYSAYKLARRIWRSQAKATGIEGAWQQFIVALNRDVITDQDNPLPLDTEDRSVRRGEWVISQLSYAQQAGNEANTAIVMTGQTSATSASQQPAGTSDNMLGDSSATSGPMFVKNTAQGDEVQMSTPGFSGTISACHEWGRMTREVNNVPNLDDNVHDSLFAQMIQESKGTVGATGYVDDIIDRQVSEGDHPPYAQDLMGPDDSGTDDGLWIYREARFASGQKTIMVPGAEIPLGLLKIVTDGPTGTAYLDIEVAPGGYKGVHALEV